MDEFVRPATEDDIPAIAALEDEARTGLAGVQRGGEQWLDAHPRLGAPGWLIRLADPGWTTLVGGLDGLVLAGGSMRLPLGRPRPVAEIEGIYVSPDARAVGLGEALLGALIDAARAAGAREIDAAALPGDRETKNLFERFGMVARLIVVNRRLDG